MSPGQQARSVFPQDGSLCWNICVSGRQRRRQGRVRKLLAEVLSGRTQLERGEAARIARKLGCSREAVRQAMSRLGVSIKPPAKPQSCIGCGKAMKYRKTRLCRACRLKNAVVSLTCTNCGRVFERRSGLHAAYLRRTVTRKRRGPVCSSQCSAKIPRSCSWCGRPAGLRWRAHAALHTFCGLPATCRFQAQRAILPVWWRYLTADLLPMKDHLDEIAQLRATLTSKSPTPG